MPLNLKTNFKPRVAIKRSEKCSWKRHFRGCARDLIGYVDLLAKNNRNRFVMSHVPAITEGCNGRYRKNEKPYSKSMVEKTLALLRDHKIVSERMKMTIDGVEREGFVVASHESMTIRYPRVCVVAGIGKGPGTFVNDIWVPDASSAEWFGKVTEFGPKITDEITVSRAESYGVGGAVGCAVGDMESLHNTEVNADDDLLFPPASSVIDVPNLVSQLTSRTSRTTEPANPSDHRNDATIITPLPRTDSENPCALLTNEKQSDATEKVASSRVIVENPPARPAALTIKEFFDGSTDPVSLVTQGQLDQLNSDWMKFKHQGDLEDALRDVIRESGRILVKDSTVLAGLMDATIVKLAERYPERKEKKELYPHCWLLTKKLLGKGLQLKKRKISPKELMHRFFATIGTTEIFKALSLEEKEAMLEAYMQNDGDTTP
jgi:hypothetical protein